MSFPAAAVAIAMRRHGDGVRQKAIELIASGGTLPALARLLRLPFWSRRLPPEAFRLLPDFACGGRDDDAAFGARILNLMPQRLHAAAGWLETVLAARALAGDDFAVWIGGAGRTQELHQTPVVLQLLGMYAWHSRHPDQDAALSIKARWRRNMGLARAVEETRYWLFELLMQQSKGRDQLPPARWSVNGFEIVALKSPADILEEARAMQNCLWRYAGNVAAGRCRLYGFRLDGSRVATLEVRPSLRRNDLAMHQFCGPKNDSPPLDAWHVAHTWFRREKKTISLDFPDRSAPHDDGAFLRLAWDPLLEDIAGRCDGRVAWPPPSIAHMLRDLQNFAYGIKLE